MTGLTTVALTSFGYDPAGQVTHLQNKNGSGTNIANFTYTYDNGGNMLTEQRNGTTTNYGYDADNQLTADGTQTMGFDNTGNRTYTYNGTTTATYATTTGNQLQSDGTWSFTYDPVGNLGEKTKGINAETWTYGYDNKNQLIQAKQWDKDPNHGGTELQEDDFKYDAFGNRIEQVILTNISSSTQRYALDGWQTGMSPMVGTGATDNSHWNVWADLDGGNLNALETRYLRGNVIDQLFARLDKNGSNWDGYWLLTDRQGSVRDVTDNTGVVKDTITYDGYGNINLNTETNSAFRGRYTYDSREFDSETDLLYSRARYYSAKTGRWTSQDPIGFDAGDSNLYRYVNNKPTNHQDPSGLAVEIQSISVTDKQADNIPGNPVPLGPIVSKDQFAWGFKVTIKAKVDGTSKLSDATFKQDIWWFGFQDPAVGNDQRVWLVKEGPNFEGKYKPYDLITKKQYDDLVKRFDWGNGQGKDADFRFDGYDNKVLFGPAAQNIKVGKDEVQYVDAPGYPGAGGNSQKLSAKEFAQTDFFCRVRITAEGTNHKKVTAEFFRYQIGYQDICKAPPVWVIPPGMHFLYNKPHEGNTKLPFTWEAK